MHNKRLLKYIVVLMLLMFLADKGASKFYWYNSIWYFDMIMHFFGGLWVGLFFIYVFSLSGSVSNLIFKIILSVLLVGISWEVFEFVVNNVIGRIPFNTLDTISDVLFDLTGGFFSIFYLLRHIVPVGENGVQ